MNVQTSAAEVLKPVADVIQLIPVDKIDPSPTNARKEFPKEYIAELGASMARDGQQQAGKVRPLKNGRFQLIFGECRWRGAKAAGVELYKAIVEEMDDERAERLCLIENLKRRELTVFEEAEHLKMLHEKHKVKIEDLSVQVGVAVRTLRENIKLATVAPDVQKLVVEEKLKLSLAKLISRLPSADTQGSVAIKAVAEQMTHEDLEKYIRERHMQDLRFAPFDIKAKGLECVAASCVDCPHNARNLKEEMSHLKGADVCTAPQSYREKVIRFGKAEAARQGGQFMDGGHLFNRWGELDQAPGRRSALYVRADAQHPKDPKERPWRELVSAEDFKKHLVIVLTPKAELMELLDNEKGGVDAAVKADGKLAKAIERRKDKDSSSAVATAGKSREQMAKEFQALVFKQRVTAAVIPQLVAKMTKWPKVEVLKLTAKRHLSELDLDWKPQELGQPLTGLPQRRGWESLEAAGEAIDRMKENDVLTLIWEATFDWNMNGVTHGQLSPFLLDFAKLLGVDVKKVEGGLKDTLEWVKNPKAGTLIPGTETKTKPETVMISLYGKTPFSIDVLAPNEVALFWWNGQVWCCQRFKTVQQARAAAEDSNRTEKAPKGNAEKADPLDSPGVAKAKAKKKAAKAKKGGR